MADSDETNYDVSLIDVSPEGMNTLATKLVDLAQAAVDSLGRINTQLEGLRLAWAGKAASDAREVADEWVRVCTELFGTEENPEKGVLPVLADGLGMASGNFSKAEVGVAELFTKFRGEFADTIEAMESEDSGEDSGKDDDDDEDPSYDTPDEVTDTNKTAITMTFD